MILQSTIRKRVILRIVETIPGGGLVENDPGGTTQPRKVKFNKKGVTYCGSI